MDQFEILALIGEGTYGQVFRAKAVKSGKIVAIKKFKESDQEDEHVRKTVLREIRVLKNFQNENIVRLLQVFREDNRLFLVFEFVERTLLEELESSPEGLPIEKLKYLTFQMLRALYFMHQNDLIHRDVKPENLLVSQNGILKVCDFGFTRSTLPNASAVYTDYVSTRWYRSPELLVGDANYDKTVDVWAIGCIYAEMFNGMPLFPGESDLHTLKLIIDLMGEDQGLTDKQVQAFVSNPIYDGIAQLPDPGDGASRLSETLDCIDDLSLDFLSHCLQIDPELRWSAEELLNHPLFDEQFKIEFNLNFNLWVAEEHAQNLEFMSDLIPTTDLSEADLLKPKNGLSTYIPEEFCNVDEMLSQLEMRKSLADASLQHQNSLGYSVQDQIQEENSDTSSSQDEDISRAPNKQAYSSSAEAKSSSSDEENEYRSTRMRERHTMDEGIQSINMEMDDHASGPYEDQSPTKKPMIDVSIAMNTQRSNEREGGEEGSTDGRVKKQIIFSNAVGFSGFSPKSQNQTGNVPKIMNASSSNGSLFDHNNARDIILQQLQNPNQGTAPRQQMMSQMSSHTSNTNHQTQLMITGQPVGIQSNSRALAYHAMMPQHSEHHNRSLEVIVESPAPPNLPHANGIGSSTNQSALTNYQQPQASFQPYQQALAGTSSYHVNNNMLISSQNGHVKSLQSSLKMKHLHHQLNQQHQFTPVTKSSSKYNPQHQEIIRNNSQEFQAMGASSMSQGTIAQNAVDQHYMIIQNNNLSGLKKINITFHQDQQQMRDSMGHGLVQHEMSMSPKLKQVYNPKLQQQQVVPPNNFLKRNPNYMNQTARDSTPVKLNQQMINRFMIDPHQTPQIAAQSHVGAKANFKKGGSSSLEKINYDPSGSTASASQSPDLKQNSVKLPNMKGQYANQSTTSMPINVFISPTKIMGGQITSTVLQPQKMHGSPSPIKPGFPKLIDQIKDTESHKSFLKVNSMSVHEQHSHSPDVNLVNHQQPVMISFNNQFLNDSINHNNPLGSSFTNTNHHQTIIPNNRRIVAIPQQKENQSNNVRQQQNNMVQQNEEVGGQQKVAGGKATTGGLYEMDSFPRRSITNRLKNVQMLQNKKKRVSNQNDRTTATMFPQINSNGPNMIGTNQQNQIQGGQPIMMREGVKIIDIRNNSLLPDTQNAFNQALAAMNGSRHHNQMAGHSTVFKMKAGGYGGGFFKPKTPGEAYFIEPTTFNQASIQITQQNNQQNYQSNQQNQIVPTVMNGMGTKSPNPSDKGIQKLGSSIMSGVSGATTFASSNTKTVRIGHTTTQIINPVLSTNLNYVPIRSTFA